MSRPAPDREPSDDQLLRQVRAVLDKDEPPPPWAAGFAADAFVWRDMDGRLAELLHDSALEDAVMLRGDDAPRLLVFQSGDLTLDVEHGPDQLAGSLLPAGRYRVGIQQGGPPSEHVASPALLTDDAGMFELDGAVRGPVRFVVTGADGQVAIVSPWVHL